MALHELKTRPFSQPKHRLFEQAILLSSNVANFRNRHRKFPPSHNLLSSKEHGYSFVVRSNSLRCKTRTSHRFKAFSPPFCAKNRFRLVPSENSAKSFFDRALNRGRRTESRVLFGYFLHDAKSDNSFSLQRTSRFSKPRFSSPQWRLRTNKIKTFPKESSEVFQTSIQLAAMAASHQQN